MSKFFRITIEDATGKSYFYATDLLRKDVEPTPLQHNPINWQDIEFSFDTNSLLLRTIPQRFHLLQND
jgi:hypothetical protein